MDIKYLQLLSKEYPDVTSAACEIINLSAINCLPKGTEFFFSDVHGEYEAFLYLLRSASGEIKNKIDQIFSHSIPEDEREKLADLIYYPEKFMSKLKMDRERLAEWQRITIFRLIEVCRAVSSKYTRHKVRCKMPETFSVIFDELLNVNDTVNKDHYYEKIIETVTGIDVAEKFIAAICELIRNLSIDSLHIIGDIYDRGPRADIIMEELIHFHNVDIQWGNHDISWMGAASGNRALIANVLRMAISYNGFDLLEDGYGINLRALSTFAASVYRDDPCEIFKPHLLDLNQFDPVDADLAAKMNKAITVIQLKLESQLIDRHPEYGMDSRNVLKAIDFSAGTVTLEGKTYPLLDTLFPTVDPSDPSVLTDEEETLMEVLEHSFTHSKALQRHIAFLYSNGSMYKIFNGNLLYHGCIPMCPDGSFDEIGDGGVKYKGRALMDYLDKQAGDAYFLPKGSPEQKKACDFMWYLWCGPKSPVFGKSKLAVFENIFIEDREARKEEYNPYYTLSQQEYICRMIFSEFGMDGGTSHIINGHVPVKIKDGESPVKANGKLFIIDGGISKAYQSKTGIAGYTLIYNSYNLSLAEHKPFLKSGGEITASTPDIKIVENKNFRVMISDTDTGAYNNEKIADLKELIKAYRKGIIKEHSAH